MIKLKGLLKENTDKVYIEQNTLWVSHRPDSGTTTQIKGDPDKFRGYWTDKVDDDHYDYNARRIVDWANSQTPIVRKSSMSLYKIPGYWGRIGDAENLSIWGGDKKPNYYIWLYVGKIANGNNVVSLFKTKSEALAFWGG